MATLSNPAWIARDLNKAPVPSMATTALKRHVMRCVQARSHWFSISCAAESVHEFVAPRFVTVLTVVALALSAAAFFA